MIPALSFQNLCTRSRRAGRAETHYFFWRCTSIWTCELLQHCLIVSLTYQNVDRSTLRLELLNFIDMLPIDTASCGIVLSKSLPSGIRLPSWVRQTNLQSWPPCIIKKSRLLWSFKQYCILRCRGIYGVLFGPATYIVSLAMYKLHFWYQCDRIELLAWQNRRCMTENSPSRDLLRYHRRYCFMYCFNPMYPACRAENWPHPTFKM